MKPFAAIVSPAAFRLKGVLLAAVLASSCAVNPATGEREISLVSESQEIAMGREADPAITAQMGGEYDDPQLQARVSELGMSLAQASERPDLPWTFRVLDDDLINAFALPGGFIYVTRGILSYMNSEAELVGVLGHEVGHVTARHTASRITRQQLGMIGVVGGAIFSETVRNNAGLALQGLQLLMLRYSREDESESDALGYRYMTRINYHPQGISEVMQMLQSTSPSAEEMGIPTWMLSHPDPGNRVEANERRLARDAENGQTFEGYARNQSSFLDLLDGMVFGKDPRQGYFIDTRFLHPVLRFEITFPRGWGTQNGAQAVQAGNPEQTAIMGLTFADAESAAAAMNGFAAQEGVQTGRRTTWNEGGVDAVMAEFTAATEQGTLAGAIMYADYGGAVYQILGYGPSGSWGSVQGAVTGAIQSFRPLTDGRLLDVAPHRIEVMTVPANMSFTQFLNRYPSTVADEEVALANQVDMDATLSRGQRVKRIVGGRIPTG
ncbi:MAG: M48 family metalloprotease [Gemmatimonadetes bacterium]|nr:M48 family metalloprotease [Gemmatimonadota bacterium]